MGRREPAQNSERRYRATEMSLGGDSQGTACHPNGGRRRSAPVRRTRKLSNEAVTSGSWRSNPRRRTGRGSSSPRAPSAATTAARSPSATCRASSRRTPQDGPRSSDAMTCATAPTTRPGRPLEYGAHVRDVHRKMAERLELMLTEDAPTFPNWDQDATAVEDRYGEQDPATVAGSSARPPTARRGPSTTSATTSSSAPGSAPTAAPSRSRRSPPTTRTTRCTTCGTCGARSRRGDHRPGGAVRPRPAPPGRTRSPPEPGVPAGTGRTCRNRAYLPS